jgi:subtilisin family serine protease
VSLQRRAAFRIGPCLVAAALVLAMGPSPASAAVRFDPELVALLAHAATRRHALADASGRLPVVVELPPGADARALGLLPLSPGLAAVRLLPSELPHFLALHPSLHFSIWPGLRPVLDTSARLNRVTAYRTALVRSGSPFAGTGRGVVVGIVDTGIDPSHPDLRDAAGATRIAWMLDFSSLPRGLHPELEEMFGCTTPAQSTCAVLDKSDIDRALAGHDAMALRGDPIGHGTHVTSIAAGNGGADVRFVGSAPEATIIVAPVAHGDGAATVADVDVVTATRFIFDRAEQMGLPAVVNLSLGGDFGPHDGTTPIEVALSHLVGPAHPGRAIVVAAGNSGALYRGDEEDQVFGIHSETRVTRGVPAKLTVLTPDARKGIDVSGTAFVWITYEAADVVSIGLTGPKGMSIRPVAKGRTAGFRAEDDSLTAAIYNGAVGAESPLPAGSHGAVIVWDGKWPAQSEITLELEGEGFARAWVEATFEDPAAAGGIFFEVATRAGTINVPASHPDLIAVGCTINRTEWIDRDFFTHDIVSTSFSALAPADGSCYFSSAGPTATGASKPDISAPGAMVAAAMSRDADPATTPFSAFVAPPGLCPDGNDCLVVDGTHALLSGSSMASPQVAGAIALLLERDPRLSQPEILRILQSGARRPVGPITADYQLGAGALDVIGAMTVLDGRTTAIVRTPDAAASWLTLADNYVHPGAGPPLVGTVAVRAADDGIADGFEPARLTLSVGQEGIVEQPLSRVGPGLYRFALRAAPGTGSRLLRLDVAIDGVAIGADHPRLAGHRLVPIGADRWIASGSARIYGGCTVGPRVMGRHTAPSWAAFFLSSIAVAAARRVRFWRTERVSRTCRHRIPTGSQRRR